MQRDLIVVVEDEDHLAQGLLFNLEAEGFRTRHFADGAEALQWLATTHDPIGVILLDVMLPGASGFHIAQSLRDLHLFYPILMLTARSQTSDVLEGLNAGADDYLPKPFDLELLLARIRTLLRRAAWQRTPATAPTPPEPPAAPYHFADRSVAFDALELSVPGRPVTRLTVMEADLLRYLIEREGRIVPRKDILEQVWRLHEDTDTRAIDNFIVRLRRYIEEDASEPRHLLTARGIGYRFVANP